MFIEAKCARCGKVFIPAPEHALVAGNKRYCSCTCFLHRNDKATDTRRKARYKVLQYTKDGEYIKTYDSARIAADLLGVTSNTIAEACRSGRTYKGFIWKYAKDIEKER